MIHLFVSICSVLIVTDVEKKESPKGNCIFLPKHQFRLITFTFLPQRVGKMSKIFCPFSPCIVPPFSYIFVAIFFLHGLNILYAQLKYLSRTRNFYLNREKYKIFLLLFFYSKFFSKQYNLTITSLQNFLYFNSSHDIVDIVYVLLKYSST